MPEEPGCSTLSVSEIREPLDAAYVSIRYTSIRQHTVSEIREPLDAAHRSIKKNGGKGGKREGKIEGKK